MQKAPAEDSAAIHWAGIAEKGTLLGLRTMLAAYEIAGRWLYQPFAAVAALYFGLTSADARNASYQFLDRVWRYSEGQCGLKKKPSRWTPLSHFQSFANAVLDKLSAWKGDIAYEQVDHSNLELFESRAKAGAGGIWITSHLGNIEVCRAIGQRVLDLKLTVLMHTLHAGNFNKLLQEVAPDSNIELLEVAEFNMVTALKLQERISKGRFIVVVGDRTPIAEGQDTPSRVLECTFLGYPANFPLGPYMLATLLDCPAGTLFCVREGKRFKMFFDDLPGLQGISRRERSKAIDSAARTFAHRLQSLAVDYPLQWFNFYPFWTNGDKK